MASTATRTVEVISALWRRRAERLDFAAPIRLAGGAHAVRPLRLVADRTLVDAGRLQAMRGPPLVATGARLSALGDCHGRPRSIATHPLQTRLASDTGHGLRGHVPRPRSLEVPSSGRSVPDMAGARHRTCLG